MSRNREVFLRKKLDRHCRISMIEVIKKEGAEQNILFMGKNCK